GVIVDVSHCGQRTSLAAARASERPICASHSACYALFPHSRGKTDEVIGAIAEKGGFIGITCVPGFLGGKGDIRAMLDHVDHVAKTFGVEHAAIGTDTCHMPSNYFAVDRRIFSRREPKPRWETLKAEGAEPGDPQYAAKWESAMLSMRWTNWPLFTVGLVQRGYSDEEIEKIIGGNALRVAGAALGERGIQRRGREDVATKARRH
ncbi:MAG: membrane dipeptidase, partial [Planctomycetota bacterium]